MRRCNFVALLVVAGCHPASLPSGRAGDSPPPSVGLATDASAQTSAPQVVLQAPATQAIASTATPGTPDPDMVELQPAPTLVKLGDTPWCWKKPTPMPALLAYPLRYMTVELERAVVADVIAGAPDSGLFKELGNIGLGLQKNADNQGYVIGPVDFDQTGLPSNLHVVTQPYVAVAKGFDKSSTAFSVYLIAMQVDGYVEDPDGNRALRASLEIQAVADDKTIANRYLRTVDFCVTSTADETLTLALRAGAEG